MSGLGLTSHDVAALLREPNAAVRRSVAEKIAHQVDQGALTSSERVIAEEIVRTLCRDKALSVRRSLAEALKCSSHLPHDVALAMARDVEQVAVPVLQVSQLFSDDDLVLLLSAAPSAKQSAIAGRDGLSARVSEAVVELAGEEAVGVLMGNETAAIQPAAFTRALQRFPDCAAVHEPMTLRSALPPAIAARLVSLVSGHLQKELLARHQVPAGVLDDLVMRTRESMVVRLVDASTQEHELASLIAELDRKGELTSSLLIRALCVGDRPLFEAGLAHMAGVKLLNARRLIADEGEQGLAAIWAKAGLDAALLPAVRAALDVLGQTALGADANLRRHRETLIQRFLSQAEAFSRAISEDDLHYLLSRLGEGAPAAAGEPA